MDVEKTMAFLLEQQAKFDASLAASKANLDAETKELRKNQKATERLINAWRKSSCIKPAWTDRVSAWKFKNANLRRFSIASMPS